MSWGFRLTLKRRVRKRLMMMSFLGTCWLNDDHFLLPLMRLEWLQLLASSEQNKRKWMVATVGTASWRCLTMDRSGGREEEKQLTNRKIVSEKDVKDPQTLLLLAPVPKLPLLTSELSGPADRLGQPISDFLIVLLLPFLCLPGWYYSYNWCIWIVSWHISYDTYNK